MVRFDDALKTTIDTLRAQLAPSVGITVVRDTGGQLTVVLADDARLESDKWAILAKTLNNLLGPMSPGPQRILLRTSDLFDSQDILDSPDRVKLQEFGDVWLVDRLLTNQDWLRTPPRVHPRLPLGVAFSLKGGVGRSTAVAVLAWYLARHGKRVVVVDLDLEAPGLGSILLGDLPAYGLADWLVEALVGQADRLLLEDCLAPSPVADECPGVVQVLPAFGQRTRDYVLKIGRVFLPGIGQDGVESGLAERIDMLIKALVEREESPDVVLLDTRAGLHDIGAAAVTQLGAEAFVFARDEPQSWQTYRLLFEHLTRSRGITYGMPDEDLRWRLKMVGAQLDKTEGALAAWIESLRTKRGRRSTTRSGWVPTTRHP